ncbi:MAG TPA: DUF1761 domain-containing protein [Candidatus Saccharimonadales bacterium]|nr:DUF1761 domain-containing protein [Candidatus Saccharimonadales bacterium]
MQVEVNWLAVVLATLSTMVVGSVWYTPKVFGNTWMRLVHLDRKKAQTAGLRPILITLAVSFISAYVLAHVVYLAHFFFNNSFLLDSLSTAFWLWLGMTAARFITHDAFEGRPVALTVINVAHELVTFLVMGLVIGLLAP